MLVSQHFPTSSPTSHHRRLSSPPSRPRPEPVAYSPGSSSSSSSSPTSSLPHSRSHSRSYSQQSHAYSISSSSAPTATAAPLYNYYPQPKQHHHRYQPHPPPPPSQPQQQQQQPLNYAAAAPRSAAHVRSLSTSSSTSSTHFRPTRPRPPPVAGQYPAHQRPMPPQQQYELYAASMQSQYHMAAQQPRQVYAQPTTYLPQQQHVMPPPQQYAGHHQYGGQQQQQQQQQQHHHHHHHHHHQQPMPHQYAHHQQYGYQTQHLQNPLLANVQQHNRRSPSVTTFSTASTVPPAAYRTSPTLDVRRSTSSRSGGSIPPASQGSSYVALLRRQKATVWSASAQNEDPNIVAQRRHDKMRATRQIAGGARFPSGSGSGRTSTGISATGKVAAKIRHHGKQTVTGFTSENHVGVGGVPVRLSATEVEGESSDEEDDSLRLNHRRTGSSGRNSIASARLVTYRPSGTFNQRRWSPGNTPERTGSSVEEPNASSLTVNAAPAVENITAAMVAIKVASAAETASLKAMSTHSGSSERADNVGELAELPKLAGKSQAHATLKREKSVNGTDELKRRGSVDERTMTLTSGRLYIANPDLD